MIDHKILKLSKIVGSALKQHSAKLTTAESCTGGWIAKAITDVTGSSDWFEYGFVTYSDTAKIKTINVHKETLEQYGAVSEPVVIEMAVGALRISHADYAISVSGIVELHKNKNSNLGSAGLIWFCFSTAKGDTMTCQTLLKGDRERVRKQATIYALETLWKKFLK